MSALALDVTANVTMQIAHLGMAAWVAAAAAFFSSAVGPVDFLALAAPWKVVARHESVLVHDNARGCIDCMCFEGMTSFFPPAYNPLALPFAAQMKIPRSATSYQQSPISPRSDSILVSRYSLLVTRSSIFGRLGFAGWTRLLFPPHACFGDVSVKPS